MTHILWLRGGVGLGKGRSRAVDDFQGVSSITDLNASNAKFVAIVLSMAAQNFTNLSRRNSAYGKQTITVANGAEFVALKMSEGEISQAREVLYLHVNRNSRKCYVGITIMEAGFRWNNGHGYRRHKRFGAAIRQQGWSAFDHYVLAFIDQREAMNEAERQALKAAGGHKSKYTYNSTPGGDAVAENDKPIIGYDLKNNEKRYFNSSAEASRELGMRRDAAGAVARKERNSVQGWWFKFEDDPASPPKVWGEPLRIQKTSEAKNIPIIAISFETGEARRYKSATAAAKDLSLTQSTVSGIARGTNHSAKGWWFKFEGDDREMPKSFGHTAMWDKRSRMVYGVNLKTGDKRKFRNCTTADTELGLYNGASRAVAARERTSAAEWWFTYSETDTPPTVYKGSLIAKLRSKPVIAEDIKTGEIAEFPSGMAAAAKLGVLRSAISQVLSGKRKSVKGYRFRLAQ